MTSFVGAEGPLTCLPWEVTGNCRDRNSSGDSFSLGDSFEDCDEEGGKLCSNKKNV